MPVAACAAVINAQVVSGHVHSYERSFPISNYTVDTCGQVYVALGKILFPCGWPHSAVQCSCFCCQNL
jgi:hypothetical protein